jgi:hypothetical protein
MRQKFFNLCRASLNSKSSFTTAIAKAGNHVKVRHQNPGFLAFEPEFRFLFRFKASV